jgi:hypothetical protein
MTVNYKKNDILSLEEYGGIDVLIPDRWKQTNIDNILKHIVLLSSEKGEEISRNLAPFKNPPYPFNPENFHTVTSVVYKDNTAGIDVVKVWLRSLPISESEDVYIFRNDKKWKKNGCSIYVAKWRHFIEEIWQICRSTFDLLFVMDDSCDWAIMFGPENAAIYIEKGEVNPSLPKTDNAHGWDLIRVRTVASQSPNFIRTNLNNVSCSCQADCQDHSAITQ